MIEGDYMSRYDSYKKKAMELLQSSRMKLFAVILTLNFISMLNSMLSSFYSGNDNFKIVSFLITVVLIAANLYVYMLFLQLTRTKTLRFRALRLNGAQILAMFLVAIILGLGNVALLFVVALALQWIPSLYAVGVFFVSLLVMMVEAIAAFAISDGYRGIFKICLSSIRFVRSFAKEMLQAAGVYILVYLTLMVVTNLLTAQFLEILNPSSEELNAIMASGSVMYHALQYEKTLMIGYALLGVQAVQLVVNSYLYAYIYTFYALLYEDAKDNFFLIEEKPSLQKRKKK